MKLKSKRPRHPAPDPGPGAVQPSGALHGTAGRPFPARREEVANITVQPSPRNFPDTFAGDFPGGFPGDPPRQRPRISFRELKELLREDYATNDRSGLKWTFLTPAFQALLAYRLGVWCNGIGPAPLRVPVRLAVGALAFLVRNFYGIELYPTAWIGRRLRIAHQHGIVLAQQVVIGDDCLVRQGVTIGAAGGRDEAARPPRLGNRVEVGAGAVLAGPISIGDDVRIGPNAVVMTDVPAGSIVTAPPSRIMTPPPRRPPRPPAEVPAEVPAAAGAPADEPHAMRPASPPGPLP
jgi:serine O-acetyltransferase